MSPPSPSIHLLRNSLVFRGLTLSYPGFFGVAEPGGRGGIGPNNLRISLILHPKLTKLGTIVDWDMLYFI